MARVANSKLLRYGFLSALVLGAAAMAQDNGPLDLQVPQDLQAPPAVAAPPALMMPPVPLANPFDRGSGLPADAYRDAPFDDFFDDIDGPLDLYDGELPSSLFDVPVIELETTQDVPSERQMRIGQFSLLHKVTAKIRGLDLRLDESVEIDDLRVTMHDCISTPPEEPPETKVFLSILEIKNGTEKPLFSGWMFASSPSIQALEHPVYDLWPKSCVDEDGRVFTGDSGL